MLQVFAAYETGLASGTSVRLNVTNATSAREVVDLVIKQLNMAVILKVPTANSCAKLCSYSTCKVHI